MPSGHMYKRSRRVNTEGRAIIEYVIILSEYERVGRERNRRSPVSKLRIPYPAGTEKKEKKEKKEEKRKREKEEKRKRDKGRERREEKRERILH
jgi:hypothetical protein